MALGGQRQAPAVLSPQKRPGIHITGSWMGHGGPSRRVRNISPSPGFGPRTVQHVAILAHLKYSMAEINFRKQLIHSLCINTNNVHNNCSYVTVLQLKDEACGGVVFKALRYKPEGRGFDFRWFHWDFSVT
jgi:hypothetical protein